MAIPNLVVHYVTDTLTCLFCDNVFTLLCLQIRYILISAVPNTEMGCDSCSLFFTDWNLRFLSPAKGYNDRWLTEMLGLGPRYIQPFCSDSQAVFHLRSLYVLYLKFRWSFHYLMTIILNFHIFLYIYKHTYLKTLLASFISPNQDPKHMPIKVKRNLFERSLIRVLVTSHNKKENNPIS